MRRHICDAGIFFDAEVIKHPATRNEFRLTNGIVRIWIDAYAHEKLLRCRGVIEIVSPRGIAHAIDARLFGFHAPRIVIHALMPEPRSGSDRGAIGGQVDTPD